MYALRQDIRYGLRLLKKNPGFTALAVGVLALGIGVNAAIFSLINSLLIRPLAIERPEQLVHLYSQSTERPDEYRAFSYPNFRDLRDGNDTFTHLLAHTFALVGVSEGEVTRRVFTNIVSSNYFETLGVQLYRGRPFLAAEEVPRSSIPVAIVSYEYWLRRGADPDLVGKPIRLNGRIHTIVGITPRGFTGTTALTAPQLYLPLGVADDMVNDLFRGGGATFVDRDHHQLLVVGRLRAGLKASEVDAELAVVAARLEHAYPDVNEGFTFIARPLPRLASSTSPVDESAISVGTAMLMAMSGVVLLIACLNLANMMLARGTARRKEFAIRTAIGGNRRRILRQLLTEGLMLSLLGGLAGLVLAFWSSTLLASSINRALALGSMSMDIVIHAVPDPRVLAATLGFCVLATLLFGLGPSWRLSRAQVIADLKENAGEGHGGGDRRGLLSRRSLLSIGQVALSLMLLTAAGLFIRGAHNAAHADPGFGLERGLVMEIDPSLIGYDETRGRETYRALLDRLRSIPAVDSVTVAATVPFGNVVLTQGVLRAGETPVPQGGGDPDQTDTSVGARFNVVGDDYFVTLGVPVIRGRPFSRAEAESDGGPRVAIVDELLARRLWPEAEAVGERIEFARGDADEEPEVMEVIGVVPVLRDDLFASEAQPHVYVPFGQDYQANMSIHLRVSDRHVGNASALLHTVRAEVRDVDERLPILALTTLQDHLTGSAGLWLFRTGAQLFTAFGALALFLAVVGIYGVRAYTVARRSREIGIRMALGATTGDALWLILREGLMMTLVGLSLGVVLAALLAQLLGAMLYEVGALDPLVFTIAPLVLAVVSLLACLIPARRAARVEPVVALRYE